MCRFLFTHAPGSSGGIGIMVATWKMICVTSSCQ